MKSEGKHIIFHIALLGCGGIARTHAECLRRVGRRGVELIAVSRMEETARPAAAELGAVRGLAPYAAALGDTSIDAVYILTPHDQHAGLAAEALRHGKHVYLEKPVARTMAEAQPLAEALRTSRDRILMVGENFHFAPALVQALEILRAGAIGRLQSIAAHGLFCVRPQGWRTQRGEAGGGALLDGGIHYIHGLRQLGGEIASVYALEPAAKWNKIEGEEAAQLLFRFTSGASATLHFSWAAHGDPPMPDFLIVGAEGSLVVNMRKKYNELYLLGKKPRKIPHSPRFGGQDLLRSLGFEAAAAHFLDCLRAAHAPAMDITEGLRDLCIVEAARESMATGKIIITELPAEVAEYTEPDRINRVV